MAFGVTRSIAWTPAPANAPACARPAPRPHSKLSRLGTTPNASRCSTCKSPRRIWPAPITASPRALGNRRLKASPTPSRVPVLVHLGPEALNLFKDLPSEGVLFPYLSSVRANDRATEFRSRCRQLGITGVTLHSYRYAWAERAKTVGYPERFAQEALGHNSKAVHRAYAKRALMKIPSLEDYEQQAAAKVESAA